MDPGLLTWQTDDLNEWKERIKCLLSSPFIPLSCPALYLSLFPGGGAYTLWGFVYWVGDGIFLLLLVAKTSGDIIIDMQTSPVPGWKALSTDST